MGRGAPVAQSKRNDAKPLLPGVRERGQPIDLFVGELPVAAFQSPLDRAHGHPRRQNLLPSKDAILPARQRHDFFPFAHRPSSPASANVSLLTEPRGSDATAST